MNNVIQFPIGNKKVDLTTQQTPEAKVVVRASDRRDAERIVYAYTMRPELVIKGLSCKIINISENGIKVIAHPKLRLDQDTRVLGAANLPSSGSVPVTGVVVRSLGDLVSIKLDQPFLASVLDAESLWVGTV